MENQIYVDILKGFGFLVVAIVGFFGLVRGGVYLWNRQVDPFLAALKRDLQNRGAVRKKSLFTVVGFFLGMALGFAYVWFWKRDWLGALVELWGSDEWPSPFGSGIGDAVLALWAIGCFSILFICGILFYMAVGGIIGGLLGRFLSRGWNRLSSD